ncbi:MAG TPA: ABC transporter substrate-binding protein [Burkholderiaceae bacterium]|nr:ABC transporter substrate-binding protein [Burkholderiaceae bacterium]
MKLKRIAALLAACGLALGVPAAQAQKLSDDKIVIGFITDMSSLYSDIDGAGGVEAIRMAIADMEKQFPGKKIELVYADHQNKADIASSKVREWIDQSGADVIIGGTNSATALASAKVAAEKKRPYISIGAASSRLTNEDCTPYTIHYAYDTVALANGTGSAVVKAGGKTWFFLTADYAFGHSLEKDTSDVVKAAGGTVVGAVRAPLNASDFSSFLLQAQNSKAQILGLANAGGDTINSIKAANEFGVTKSMKLAGLLMFINDIHSLGLKTTEGMYLTTGWYWNLNDETRAWGNRFFGKMKRMPSMLQAADYSAVGNYLAAVKATGTDDADTVIAYMKKTPINDMFAKGGKIMPNGRMVHDMYLMQVKGPAESKTPWDYFKVAQTIPGPVAFAPPGGTKCALK